MNAALRRTGGALLAASLMLGPCGLTSLLAQSRPYNPLVRKPAAEKEAAAGDAASPPSASAKSTASAKSAPATAASPKPAAAPNQFRSAAATAWRAIQIPGSNRPPIMVPPASARQPSQPYYDQGARGKRTTARSQAVAMATAATPASAAIATAAAAASATIAAAPALRS
jgi:hypothetical protein